MKKVSFIIAFVYLCLTTNAQIPQGFNYQAIARDASGNPIAGATIDVKIGILSDTITPVVVREELFSSVKTNAFGLFTLVVGTGTYTIGSTPVFANIDWVSKPLYLKTQIFYQSAWKYMGTSKLQAVPYSLVAKNLGGSVSRIKVNGTETSADTSLFEVRNKTGQIVFAVYSEGVRIYVDDGLAKGTTKGGFAIGGFGTAKGTSQPLFIVDPDSIRAYIDTSKVKTVKGGFAIGSFSAGKGMLSNFMEMTPKNYFIGEGSGSNNTSGRYNSFLGYQTGLKNTSGANNAFMGYQSGYNNTSGNNNLFLGYQSGYFNVVGSYNSFLGYKAGYNNTTGAQNSFLGSFAGANNSSGSMNTFVGNYAGYSNFAGATNSFLGYQAGNSNSTGISNVFVGNRAGYSSLTGNYNVLMGDSAGYSNTSGSSNVYIGNRAGEKSTNSPNNVFLGFKAGQNHYPEINGGNVYIGYLAGWHDSTGTGNVFLGPRAGDYNKTGYSNVFISNGAGLNNSSGYSNVFVGDQAGGKNTTGYENVVLGRGAGYNNQTGNRNVFIGHYAGLGESLSNRLYIDNNGNDKNNALIYGEFDNKILQVNGNLNVNGNLLFPAGANKFLIFPDNLNSLFIGGNPGTTHAPYAIQFVTEGASSIGAAAITIIGASQNVGFGTTAPNVKLNAIVAANTESMALGTPSGGFKVGALSNLYGLLIGVGASGNSWIQVGRTDGTATAYNLILQSAGGNVGIGTISPGYKLQVGNVGDGSQARANAWSLLSDIRFKKGFEDLTDPLDKISAIKGFYFYWNTGSDKNRQFGLSAQDVEKILPEVVSKGTDGYLSVDYGKIVPLLIEGIKVQQKQIETYKTENEDLKSHLQTLQEKVEQIESLLAKAGVK
jgi:hypothetical protein